MIKRALLWLIRAYQKQISPLSGPSCRFTPTCSNYALEAIERFGAFKGTALAVWRILRCNPFSTGGWDPVPGKKERDPAGKEHKMPRPDTMKQTEAEQHPQQGDENDHT